MKMSQMKKVKVYGEDEVRCKKENHRNTLFS